MSREADTVSSNLGTLPAETWFADVTYIHDEWWKTEIERQCYAQGFVAAIEKHPQHPAWGWVFHSLYHPGRGAVEKTIASWFREERPSGGCVYFLLSPSLGRIKIGFGRHASSRITQHQTSCPEPLVLLGVLGPASIGDEKTIHKQWHHLRRHLEWFEATPELLAWIKEHTAP